MRIERIALAAVVLLSGCDRISNLFGHKLQCHDEELLELVKGTLADQAMKAVPAENGAAVQRFFAGSPLSVSTTVQKSRADDGAIQCSATLHANLGGGSMTAEKFEGIVRGQAAKVEAFRGYGLAQKQIDEIDALLQFLPETSGTDATWSIEYDASFTSDGKQFVASTHGAEGLGLYLGNYAVTWEVSLPKAEPAPSAAAEAPKPEGLVEYKKPGGILDVLAQGRQLRFEMSSSVEDSVCNLEGVASGVDDHRFVFSSESPDTKCTAVFSFSGGGVSVTTRDCESKCGLNAVGSLDGTYTQ